MAINEKDLRCLTTVPPNDVNFKGALLRANAEVIQAALAEIEGQPSTATKKKALEARLRQLSREHVEQASEAATEVVEAGRLQVENARNEQAERERRIAECHEAIGRFQGFQLLAKFGDVTKLVWLKDVKDSKVYRDLPNVGTWDNFCKYLGLDRHTVDQDLLNLATFGEEFLVTATNLRVGYRDLRRLRQLTHEGALQVEDGILVIGGEEIPLDIDHREDLQAAMERLLDAKEQVIQEKDATLRTKDKLLKSKADLIHRQEKDLARYEGEAAKKGLTADEDAFIQKCTNARTTIDGFLLQFDPDRNPLPADASPRMKAALMETLGYFRRAIVAAHDTAGDLYGDAEMDSAGWVQPNLRKPVKDLANPLCISCRAAVPAKCADSCCEQCASPCNMQQICCL